MSIDGEKPEPERVRIVVQGGPVIEKPAAQGNYLTAEQMAEIQQVRMATIRPRAIELTRLLRGRPFLAEDPDLCADLVALAAAIEEALAPYLPKDDHDDH